MHLSHKIEIDPTNKQEVYFRKACGAARFAFNWALAKWKKDYESGEKPSVFSVRKKLNAVKREEFPWMQDVTKCASQYAIHDLGDAFGSFFKKKSKYPKFKKKGFRDSFAASEAAPKFSDRYVVLPRIGKVKLKEPLRFKGKVLGRTTISRIANKWFLSVTVELDEKVSMLCENQDSIVGVDLGVKDLAVLSTGERFRNPKPLRSNLQKLKRYSRQLSRKQKGSNNRAKAKMKLARLHYKISCIRKYNLHCLTSYLAGRFRFVCIEDLNVKGMTKNRKLARAISDCGFFEFRRQLEYKTKMKGGNLVLADRFFPSSKTCHGCGASKDDLKLSDREWHCLNCGMVHDRDLNAAKNLETIALKYRVSACGAEGQCSGSSSPKKTAAMKQETCNCH
jgi:putative transposase